MKYLEREITDLNYEVFDDKVLLFKCHGKIVTAFDLKDQIFLEEIELVNKNVLLFWRTDKDNRNYQYASIVDLNNKKYLKDVFTLQWYYKEIIDARSPYYNEAREEYPVTASHSVKVCNGNYTFNNNVIKYSYKYKGKKNIIIYDANTGELIGEENIIIYDPNTGEGVYKTNNNVEKNKRKSLKR